MNMQVTDLAIDEKVTLASISGVPKFNTFKVAGGRTMPCDRYIPGMKLTLGRCDLAQDFYVMDLPDTNIIIGV
jgi:hypothetical protein